MTDPFRARTKSFESRNAMFVDDAPAPASEATPADGEQEARRSQLDDLTKAELQGLARDLKVSDSGTKAALIDRIVEAEKQP